MKKRLRKKKSAKRIDQFTDKEIFTELMKRVPRNVRYCCFVDIKDRTYKSKETKYRVYDIDGFEICSEYISDEV